MTRNKLLDSLASGIKLINSAVAPCSTIAFGLQGKMGTRRMWLVVKYNADRHQPDVSVMNDKILPVEGLSHESVGRKKVNCSPILPVPNLSHSQETLSLFVGKNGASFAASAD